MVNFYKEDMSQRIKLGGHPNSLPTKIRKKRTTSERKSVKRRRPLRRPTKKRQKDSRKKEMGKTSGISPNKGKLLGGKG